MVKKVLRNNFFRTAILGNFMEYYDIALYGAMLPKFLTLFFPQENPAVALLWGLGTFAVGGITRPLGGILFGHIGDSYGRKYALLISIIFMFIPTFIIGITPSYETIGVTAPIIITLCRMAAGICIGGESITVIVYILEKTNPNQANYVGSLICVVSFFGVIIGGIICAIFSYEWMWDWAWRIPFVSTIFLAYCSYNCRKHLHETSKFKSKKIITKIPFIEVLRNNLPNIMCTFGLGAAGAIPFHIMTLYTLTLLKTEINLPLYQIIFVNVLNLSFMMGTLIIFGKLADRRGTIPIMVVSLIMTAIIAVPVLNLIHSGCLIKIILAQLMMAFTMSGFLSGVSAFMMGLFPVETRSSGIGFAYNLGNSVLGVTAPIMIVAIMMKNPASNYPALYLIFGSIIGMIAIFYAKKIPLPLKAII